MSAPKLVVIAGPNGSGKSTLTRKLASAGFNFGAYVNPDEIAASLVGPYDDRVRQAQKIADGLRETYIADKRSFSFETVMSHESKIEVMRRARGAGFDVTLFFISVEDPKINIERVAARVALGGHPVPEDRIVQRYRRTMESLSSAARTANKSHVFDNTYLSTNPRHIVEVVERDQGSRHFELKVPDNVIPLWVRRYLLTAGL